MSRSLPISYIERTTSYYLGLGYDNPYQWARYDDVPFAVPQQSLNRMRIAILTTAAIYDPDKGDQSPGAAYNADAKFYQVYRKPISPPPDLRISHIAIDRDHTTAEDIGTYFPLDALSSAAHENKIGSVASWFYGFPTNRSQRTHLDIDVPALIAMVKADQIDALIGVPNCPVCHQSVALAMRGVEAVGIPTVIMGCAKDIVEHVGVPRFYFSDFPLGNSCGRPNDASSQQQSLYGALDLLITATAPRTTRISPLEWQGKEDWKSDYSNISKLTDDDIRARRAAFDKAKAIAAHKRVPS
jgi:D-proline reductase (dithiol) PrdB